MTGAVNWSVLSRAVGGALLFLAGTMAGLYRARAVEREVEELGRLEMALVHLAGDISYLLTPLPVALTRAGEQAAGLVGGLMVRLGEKVGLGKKTTLAEAFSEMVASGTVVLPESVLRVVRDLANNLGSSGQKEQLEYIATMRQRVAALRLALEPESRRKAKMYRHLGVLGATCVIILLI